MKKTMGLLTVLLSVMLLSCENQHSADRNYEKYVSENDVYEVEIPSDFTKIRSNNYLLGFSKEKAHATIIVNILSSNETLRSFANKTRNELQNDNFSYSLFEQSDTSCFYKITKGLNSWSAYELYMSKQIDDETYVVKVSSDILSKERLTTLINHIQASLTSLVSDTIIAKQTEQQEQFKMWNTRYYSIKYPANWETLTDFDNMTDVYIGSTDGKIGFTVLFFDTEYSLSEVVNMGNVDMKNAGWDIVSHTKTTINEQTCYKTIYEYWMNNYHVRNVSYTLKKGSKIFNVKFGNSCNEIKANTKLIDEIIGSFKMK